MSLMIHLFTWVLNQSIGACWLMAAVIFLRFVLKRGPKWTLCLLWALVAVRLICPVSLHSPISVYQAAEISTAESDRLYHFTYSETPEKPQISVDFPAIPGYGGNQPQIPSGGQIHTTRLYVPPLMGGYYLGVATLAAYTFGSYLALKRRTAASIRLRDGVFLCDSIQSPFLLGLIAPKIYLPSDLNESAVPYVIAHEEAHRRRLDHWWKALGFALLTIHWLNPLCWLSYCLFCRDLELACDESVCKAYNIDSKKNYASALLECAVPRTPLSVSPLAFGEVGVKERVKSIGRYRKPAIAVVVVCLLVCGVVGALFLTEPPASPEKVTSVEADASSSEPPQADEQEMEAPAEYPQTPSMAYSSISSQAEESVVYLPFDDTMGYDGFVECHRPILDEGVSLGTVPTWEERYYYGWLTGDDVKILGYGFGWSESQTDSYSIDLNSDGQDELVCNCQYGGDGVQQVYVYSLDESEQLHAWQINNETFVNEEQIGGAWAVAEYYDGEQFCLDFYPTDMSGDPPTQLPEEHYHPLWPEDFVEMDLYDTIGEAFRPRP